MRCKLLLIFAIALATGCASTTKYKMPEESAGSELASVTIYRTRTFFYKRNPEKPFFYIDGLQIGKLRTGMAVTTKVTAGKHVIAVREPFLFMPSYVSGRIEYEFEAGKSYYLRYSREFSGIAIAAGLPVATSSMEFSITDEKSFLDRK
jgi:hypothetical protein